jgi:hypothetical protein
MLTPKQAWRAESKGFAALVPVERHMEAVQLVGIARLRYRPWTAPTKAFLDRDQKWRAVIQRFQALTAQIMVKAEADRLATSRRNQG